MSKKPFYGRTYIAPDGSISVSDDEIIRAAQILASLFLKRWEEGSERQRLLLASACLSKAMGYSGAQETIKFIQNPYFRQCVEALVETFEKFRLEGKFNEAESK